MVGTGAAAIADAVRLTTAAVDFGFSGVLVVPPFYFTGITDVGLYSYYASVIERVRRDDLKVYLYHYPQLSGVPFTIEVIQRLVRAYPDTIAGLKDSSGVAGFSESVAAACPTIDVFPSSEAGLAGARAAGFAGCISATFNATAALAARVWNAPPGSGRDADQAALTLMRTTITAFPLVPAVHHVAARLYDDAALERMLPPLINLSATQMQALDTALEAQDAFVNLRAETRRAVA